MFPSDRCYASVYIHVLLRFTFLESTRLSSTLGVTCIKHKNPTVSRSFIDFGSKTFGAKFSTMENLQNFIRFVFIAWHLKTIKSKRFRLGLCGTHVSMMGNVSCPSKCTLKPTGAFLRHHSVWAKSAKSPNYNSQSLRTVWGKFAPAVYSVTTLLTERPFTVSKYILCWLRDSG